MKADRRAFLLESGLLAAGALVGCRGGAPAFLRAGGNTYRRVVQQLPGMPSVDGAGVHLTRLIGQPALRHLDPFVLLDRIHSDDPDAYVRGFPDHPHRGFETVTVMLAGAIRHRDSRGNHGVITGGGAQWMTAGRGIVHSEMPDQDKGLLSGFQLWVNLPAREKLCPQYYQDLAPARLAEGSLSAAGSRVRVIAGEVAGLVGPVRERPTRPLLFTAALEDDRPFVLDTPAGHNAFVYVASGEVQIGAEDPPQIVQEGMLALLGPGDRVRLRAPARRSEVLFAAGLPLGEPIVQRGPFVMNTEEEIQRAWADYRAGVLDKT
jgi:redox-sensitive bicupin YhaK (pirin superfamily)